MIVPPSCSRQRERQRRLAARGRPCDKHRLCPGVLSDDLTSQLSFPIRRSPRSTRPRSRVARRRAADRRRTRALARSRHRRRHSLYAGRRGRQSDRASACAPRSPDRPIDVVVQPLAGRRKRLFVADMDSTMIGQECIDELADYVGPEGACRGDHRARDARRDRVRAGAARARRAAQGPAGRGGRGGHREAHHADAGRRARWSPPCGRTARYTCLVSGGFTLFTGRIAAMIGFDEHRGNTLIVEDGKLAGRVAEPILGREAKLATLDRIARPPRPRAARRRSRPATARTIWR